MVTIKLTNGYFIEREGVDHVLKREYTVEPTEKYPEPRLKVKDIGYFGKLNHAIERYLLLVQSEEMDGEIYAMSEYARAIKDFNDLTVEEIIKGVGA